MSEVNVFLANGFEEIEGLTVVDILRRAQIETCTVSIGGSCRVEGAHGIAVEADCLYEDMSLEDTKLLVLPGGMPGTKNLGDCEALAGLLKEWDEQGKRIAAICAAPSVLGKLDILNGRRAVCYPGCEDALTGATVGKERVVTDGNVTTSRGMGTAIAFALELVSLLRDPELAEEVRKSILYGHKTP